MSKGPEFLQPEVFEGGVLFPNEIANKLGSKATLSHYEILYGNDGRIVERYPVYEIVITNTEPNSQLDSLALYIKPQANEVSVVEQHTGALGDRSVVTGIRTVEVRRDETPPNSFPRNTASIEGVNSVQYFGFDEGISLSHVVFARISNDHAAALTVFNNGTFMSRYSIKSRDEYSIGIEDVR